MPAPIDFLRAELQNDPLGRGYAGMSNAQAMSSLNAVNRTRVKPSLTGDEVFNCADPTELAGLANGAQAGQTKFQMFLTICARDVIDPQGNATTRLIREIFGNTSTTVSNLNTLRQEQLSRGQEIGFGYVNLGDVAEARRV